MNRQQLDHILRAAGEVTGQTSFVLVGSTAIFVWLTAVPQAMAISREADMFAAVDDAEEAARIADELDASLGQSSAFDETYGYYCDGVEPTTAILPMDWRTRAKRYSSPATNGVSAIAPDPNDLGLSKLCAGREKDLNWLVAGVAAGILSVDAMRTRLALLPKGPELPGDDILDGRLTGIARRASMND